MRNASIPRHLRRQLWGLLSSGLVLSWASYAAPVDIAQYRGRVVYLDFWASWCGPCRQSFPWMESLVAAHHADGLVIIAVNLDHKQQDAERFLAQFHPTFEVRFDPSGAEATHWNVQAMPTSVLIDRDGVVRYTHTGFALNDRSTYESQIVGLLQQKSEER